MTLNIEAVDSLNNIDPTYNNGVTVTMSGSATGGGLVTLASGVGTTTITDATAETVTLGFRDTQSTGLGVATTTQIVFNAAAVVTAPVSTAPPTQVPERHQAHRLHYVLGNGISRRVGLSDQQERAYFGASDPSDHCRRGRFFLDR